MVQNCFLLKTKCISRNKLQRFLSDSLLFESMDQPCVGNSSVFKQINQYRCFYKQRANRSFIAHILTRLSERSCSFASIMFGRLHMVASPRSSHESGYRAFHYSVIHQAATEENRHVVSRVATKKNDTSDFHTTE